MSLAVVLTLARRSTRTQSLAWLLAPLISPTELATSGSTATPAVLQNAPLAGAPGPQAPGFWPMLSKNGNPTVMVMSAEPPTGSAVSSERQITEGPLRLQVQPGGYATSMSVRSTPGVTPLTKPGMVSLTTMPLAGTASAMARLVTRSV